MSVEQIWKTKCHNCGTTGPESDSAGSSRELAADKGWYIGQRGQWGREDDYCPDCRHRIDAEVCDQPKDDGICGSLAMYEISHSDTFHRACGRHFGGMLRDMFNGDPKVTLLVKRLRASINHKPE